ncbi:MAG TPA: hypothetical protein VMT96_00455 [Candidatus Bathyarchaeia archaeon]|nr:hypothetical protein [Candidatus Bathyarchaeia archaeon]
MIILRKKSQLSSLGLRHHKPGRSAEGFTVAELVVTVVVLSIFLYTLFQGYLVIQTQRLNVARQAHASDIAYTNLRKVTSRPAALTQTVCNTNASIMDLTAGTQSTEPGLDITQYGYTLESTTNLTQTLGSTATQTLVAYAPQGCANLTTAPVEIVSTVTFGTNGDKITHAAYVQ